LQTALEPASTVTLASGSRARGRDRVGRSTELVCGDVRYCRRRPQGQEPMIGVRERLPATDGDEAGVAVSWQDHVSNILVDVSAARR